MALLFFKENPNPMTKYWSLHPLLYYDYPKYYVYAPMKSLLTPALTPPPSWPLYKEPQGDQVWLNHVALIGVTFNMVLYDEEILIKIILLNQKDHCFFCVQQQHTMFDFHDFGLIFAGQMYCLPQRLISMLFEIFSNRGCPKKNFKQRWF